MILGIDGRTANSEQRVGIGNYCRELLRALAPPARDIGIGLRVYLDAPPRADFPMGEDAADIRVLPSGAWWSARILSAALRRNPPDVFLSPSWQMPLLCPCPVLIAAHDMAWRHWPQHFSLSQRLTARVRSRIAAHSATHFMTDSSFAAEDLTRCLGIPADRITVAPLAAAPRFHAAVSQAEIDDACAAHGVSRPCILHVGRIQPRKNIVRLIEAFEAVLQRRPECAHNLVVIGDNGRRHEVIRERAKRSPVCDRICFAGYVPDGRMPALLKAADALALVSLHEGFGLPALEAMACGAPVLASKAGALPEVVGDAALLTDPMDTMEMANALERLMTDAALREQLSAQGQARAAAFSWENTAHKTLETAQQIATRS